MLFYIFDPLISYKLKYKGQIKFIGAFLFNLYISQFVFAQSTVTKNKKINAVAQTLLWAADWSADEKRIAVGGDDSLLKFYDCNNLKLLKCYQLKSMIRQVCWHPVNNILAIATNDDEVSILNTETEKLIKLNGISNGARGIDWNFNGQMLATADNDGLVKIWDSTGILLRAIKKEDNNSYFSISWHPNKNIIAVSGDDIRIMDTLGVTLKVIKHRKENTGILTIAWHPSGDFFATGDYGHEKEGIKSIIQFWKPDGTLIKTLYGSKAEYRNIRWNKSGTLLASASDALRIWDANGKLVFTGKSKDLLWGLDWNSNSEKIVTSSISGKINIWDAKAKFLTEVVE
jgi:WD40 repeat protein